MNNTLTKIRRRITDATFSQILIAYTAIIIATGTLFAFIEAKDWSDSIWWACATATTVGYGDVFPITLAGRIIAVALMHLVPFFIGPLLVVRIMNLILEDKNEFSHDEQEEMKTDIKLIKGKLGI